MKVAAGISAALVAYNTLLNVRSTDTPAYVPLNVSAAALAVAFARSQGLDWRELGLVPEARGVRTALWMSAVAAGLLATSFAHPSTRDLLADDRAAGVRGKELAYRALVRIPIGTALVEELLFRGVLEGLWARRTPPMKAIAATNTAFGLWHIGPGMQALRINRIRGWARVGGLAGMVAGTAAGGTFLSALRRRTGSIAAPAVLHATVNSLSLVAAVLAHRAADRWGAAGRPLRGREWERALHGSPPYNEGPPRT